MNSLLTKIISNVPRAIRNPRRASALAWSRLFPYRALSADPEVYQAVSSWTFGRLPRVALSERFPGIEGEDVSVMRALDRGADAGLTSREVLVLAALTRYRKPQRILEIGTFDGNTATNLASNAPEGAVVTTVDLPPDWDGTFGLSVPENMQNVTAKSTLGAQFSDPRWRDRIQQVYGDSATMDWGALDGPFDLVFIDGCHHYDYVRSDTLNALAHLSPGGVVVWHDYGIVEDVSRAVDEFMDRMDLVAILGTCLAIGTSKRNGDGM